MYLCSMGWNVRGEFEIYMNHILWIENNIVKHLCSDILNVQQLIFQAKQINTIAIDFNNIDIN